MRAVCCATYGAPEIMRLQDVSVPEPGPEEVLVRVRAAGVSISDCVVRSGRVRPLMWIPIIIPSACEDPAIRFSVWNCRVMSKPSAQRSRNGGRATQYSPLRDPGSAPTPSMRACARLAATRPRAV